MARNDRPGSWREAMNAINRFPIGVDGDNDLQLSVVVPFYNEREVLPLCLHRISGVLSKLRIPTEIVFVDDGSVDSGSEILSYAASREPAHGAPRVRVVRLSRNFGKEAAMTAGIEHANGEAVVVLDADLQDPPELNPRHDSRVVPRCRRRVDAVAPTRWRSSFLCSSPASSPRPLSGARTSNQRSAWSRRPRTTPGHPGSFPSWASLRFVLATTARTRHAASSWTAVPSMLRTANGEVLIAVRHSDAPALRNVTGAAPMELVMTSRRYTLYRITADPRAAF